MSLVMWKRMQLSRIRDACAPGPIVFIKLAICQKLELTAQICLSTNKGTSVLTNGRTASSLADSVLYVSLVGGRRLLSSDIRHVVLAACPVCNVYGRFWRMLNV